MPDSPELPIGWYDGDDGVRRYWDGAAWRTPVGGEPAELTPGEPSRQPDASAAAVPSSPAQLRWPEEPTVQAPTPVLTAPREPPVFFIGTVLAVLVPIAGLLIGLWARREYVGSMSKSARASGIIKLSIGFLIAQIVILAVALGIQVGNSSNDARVGAYGDFCTGVAGNASTFDAVIDWPHNHTTYDEDVDAYVAIIPTMRSVAVQLRSDLPSSPDGAVTEKLDQLDLTLTGVEDSLADGSFLNSNQRGNSLRDAASAVRGLLDSRFCG